MKMRIPLRNISTAILAASALLATSKGMRATDYTWNTATSGLNWTNAAGWAGGALPSNTGNDNVSLNGTGTAQQSLTINSTVSLGTGSLTWGMNGTNSTLFISTGGNLTAGSILTGNGRGKIVIQQTTLANAATTLNVANVNAKGLYVSTAAAGSTAYLTVNGGQSITTAANGIGIGNAGGGGTLQLDSNGSLTTSGGDFVIQSDTAGTKGTFILNGGTLTIGTGRNISRAGSNAAAGDVQFLFNSGKVASGTATMGSANGTLDISLSSGSSHTFEIGASGTMTQNSTARFVDQTSNGGFTKTGAGTLLLKGSNTYTGTADIQQGTLSLSGGTLGGSTAGVNVNGGTLELGGTTQVVGTATFTSGTTQNGTLNATSFSGQSGTVNAVLAGNGTFTKTTSGTLTLSAANTYTGVTTISAGTVILSSTGSIANSSAIDLATGGKLDVSAVTGFTVANAQTLKGSGTVTGALTMASGSILAIGNSPGTITFDNNLTLGAGSTSNFEINGLTAGLYDLAQGGAGSQTVDFGGTLNLLFQSGFNTSGTVKIFDFENYANSFTTVNTSGLASGYTATFDSLTGVVTVVPEPATWALLAGGLTVAMVFRRRSNRIE